MERNKVDYHIHYNPEKNGSAYSAIDKAKNAGVTHMALLARSEVSPDFNKYKMYAETKGVKVETGVEMVTDMDGVEVGLVGLGFENNQDIQSWLGPDADKEKNARLAHKQMAFLQSEGFDFSNLNGSAELLHKLLSGQVIEKAINFCKIATEAEENAGLIAQLKKDHKDTWHWVVDRYSDKPEYEEMMTPKFLYTHYFAHGRPGNFTSKTDTKSAIERLQVNGGVALYSPEGDFNPDTWDKLKDKGIDGIMAWHGSRMELPLDVIKEARGQGYLILGGSDYQEKDWQVGVGDGSMFISQRRSNELLEKLSQKRTYATAV